MSQEDTSKDVPPAIAETDSNSRDPEATASGVAAPEPEKPAAEPQDVAEEVKAEPAAEPEKPAAEPQDVAAEVKAEPAAEPEKPAAEPQDVAAEVKAQAAPVKGPRSKKRAAPEPPEDKGIAALRAARESGTLVKGKVFGWNNAGFHVVLDGLAAFCPRSEMELGQPRKPQGYMDQTYDFLVLKVQKKGRRIVVSRAAILRDEKERVESEAREKLEVGTVVTGTVSSITDFGAFVDLGGVEGLVHVSEVSRQRVDHASKVLSIGQEVEVKILKMENDGKRISLSMKSLEPDPWAELKQKYPVGSVINGTVERTTNFGAFVELEPGLSRSPAGVRDGAAKRILAGSGVPCGKEDLRPDLRDRRSKPTDLSRPGRLSSGRLQVRLRELLQASKRVVGRGPQRHGRGVQAPERDQEVDERSLVRGLQGGSTLSRRPHALWWYLLALLCVLSAPLEAVSQPRAVEVAERMMDAMGGVEALEKLRLLRFDFVVTREGEQVVAYQHWWDRTTGRYRVEGVARDGSPFRVLLDLESRDGSVWVGADRLEGDDAKSYLERAYGRYINDTYWLLMPWKWLDPGVHLTYEREEVLDGRVFDVVGLRFDTGIGLTSGDRYWGWVARDTNLMERWGYVLQEEDGSPGSGEPTVWLWEDWEEIAEGVKDVARNRIKSGDGSAPSRFPVLNAFTTSDEGALLRPASALAPPSGAGGIPPVDAGPGAAPVVLNKPDHTAALVHPGRAPDGLAWAAW